MIKIVSRWDSEKVIVCGEYESIKECLEKNRGAHLRDADLRDADLRGAYLEGAYLGDADLRDADLRDADLGGAYLRDADLRGANLRDADLEGAYLEGAYLGDAYLGGAKGYYNSHAFLQEIIRRQPVKAFTDKKWVCIGQTIVHELCYGTLKKRFPKIAKSVFTKLKKVGFGEYLKHFEDKRN